MANFNQRGGSQGGFRRPGSGFGGRDGGRDQRGPATMYKATCAECGNMCEVPFRPNGEKPVYCSNCFSNKRGSDDRAPRRDFGRPSPSFNRASAAPSNDGEVKRQLEAISYKLDQLTRTIERLTAGKTEVKTESPKAEVKKMVVKSTKTTKAPAKKAKKK